MTEISRRRLLTGMAGLGASMFAAPAFLNTARAATSVASAPLTAIRAVSRQIEVNGKAARVYGLIDDHGNHGLTVDRTANFAVRLENRLADPTLIHWHGLTPPWHQDGVPDISQPLLQPGGHYDYRFALDTAGTFWMHSHQGLQEQQLLAAPLIIRDAADRKADLQDVVVMLHDFTFSDPQEVLATLQADGSGQKGDPAPATRTMDSMGAMGTMGTMNGMDNSGSMNGTPHDMSGMMNGGQMDINDIDFDAYLANERTLDDPEIVEVERGGRVRLRLINGASATGFTIDLGDLSGTLIAVDGMMVAGLSGSRFAITMAQRLDIVMQMPTDGQARPILALREGGRERTGIILRPRGAEIAKLPTTGTQDGPVIDLVLEQKLRAASPLARRKADRTVNVDLAGTMTGYHWSMAVDGTAGAPVHVRHGERVEITLRNQSMMSHPMHLHGHHFQVVAINGTRLFGALRDTVLVPAGRNVTIAFDADNPGKWAFHCHHMYHMATGMFTTLNYGSIT